jgi:hypothetical protein
MRMIAALSRLCRAGVMILLVGFLGGMQLPPAGAAIPSGPPPGYARIWIYRYDEPYVSLATPYVRFNGQIVGVSEPGGAFYRDVSPGEYYVTVDSEGTDINQFAHVAVVAGQPVYIEVEVSKFWDCMGSLGGRESCRDTFYTRLQLPQIGAAAVAHSPRYGGS